MVPAVYYLALSGVQCSVELEVIIWLTYLCPIILPQILSTQAANPGNITIPGNIIIPSVMHAKG